MKQLIVLLATMILGLAIGALVVGFGDDAENMADKVTGQLDSVITSTSAVTW